MRIKNIGSNIKEYRLKKGLTQKALGELTGKSEAQIGQYERGYRTPKVETLKEVAKALDVSLNALLNLKENESNEQISKSIFQEKYEDMIIRASDELDIPLGTAKLLYQKARFRFPFDKDVTDYKEVISLIEAEIDIQGFEPWLQFETKLAHIKYRIGGDETEGYLWIETPKGTIEVSEGEIHRLNKEVNEFLEFKIESLKKSRPFHPNKTK